MPTPNPQNLIPVHEVKPLECPECGSEMEIIAFIRNPAIVHEILDHLDMLTSENDPPEPGRCLIVTTSRCMMFFVPGT